MKKQIDDETESKDQNSIGQSRNELSDENQQLKGQSELQTEKTV